MTDTYKVLGQTTSVANEDTSAYVVPSGVQASISSLLITNTSGQTSYTLSAVSNADYQDMIIPAYSETAQIGDTLRGEADDSQTAGESIALTPSGDTVIIGYPLANNFYGGGNSYGKASIYDRSGNSWVQRGPSLGAGVQYAQSGFSVDVSSDGNFVAVGSPGAGPALEMPGLAEVYRWDAGLSQWVQLGSDLSNQNSGSSFGCSVAIAGGDPSDGDGTVLVVGARLAGPPSGSGQVRIYRYIAANGGFAFITFVNGSSGSETGTSVSVSSDGSLVLIGEPNHSTTGRVRLFYSSGYEWSQVATFEGFGGRFGQSVSMSPDGTSFCVGAPLADSGNGVVYSYELVNPITHSWTLVGNPILNPLENPQSSQFGHEVGISNGGSSIIVGIPQAQNATGAVCIFDFDGTDWVQRSGSYIGEQPNDELGRGVSINGDGLLFAIGAPYGDTPTNASGYVKIYETTVYPESLDSPPAKCKIISEKTIASGEHHEIAGGIQLSEEDRLMITSTSGDLVVNIFGVEMS